jgi:glycosyltransferase involved in cell wall biosynthesis
MTLHLPVTMAHTAPQLVLMTTDTLGGVWSYAVDLAGGLARAGTRTVLASMGPPPSKAQRSDAAAVPGLILEQSTFALEWMPDADDEVRRAGDWLLDLERRHAPDIVHLNGYAHAALPWRAPCIVVAHSCIPSWWRAVHGGPPTGGWHRHLEIVAGGLAAADLVVAPTAAHLRAIETISGPCPGARAIHNGVDPTLLRSGSKRPVIFSAGRVWDAAKNVRALDQVAARLPWPVVVAGDWRQPDGGGEPPSQLLCLSVLERAQVRDWLAEASIYASPAYYEPFGLGVLEAALSGCALVLGDIATLRELWSDAALFVPPDDYEALLACLTDLIERPSLRAQLGEMACARGLRYSLERMTQGYLDAYAATLAAGSLVSNQPAALPTAAGG